jgi:hypothetical protein
VREARAIAGPRTHLQDSEALIQFGLKVAKYAAQIPSSPSRSGAGQEERGPEPPRQLCAARRYSAPDPMDCDWPFCGCDPAAENVIQALQEMDMLKEPSGSAGSGRREEEKEWLRVLRDKTSALMLFAERAIQPIGGSGGRRQCRYCLRNSYAGQPEHYDRHDGTSPNACLATHIAELAVHVEGALPVPADLVTALKVALSALERGLPYVYSEDDYVAVAERTVRAALAPYLSAGAASPQEKER